jgi:hypothetical protein
VNRNAVKFAVGCDSTVQKLVEKAFLDGCDQSRWFRPEPHVSTYMELAHAAAREYAQKLFGTASREGT